MLTLPVAVYLTRFSEGYELLHAGFSIPIAAALGLLAIVLARRTRRRSSISLVAAQDAGRLVTLGWVLGVLGLCIAAAGLVALGVYGLLEYVGTRE